MFKFDETALSSIFQYVLNMYLDNNIYSFILSVPFILLVIMVGGIMAIIVDTCYVIIRGVWQ